MNKRQLAAELKKHNKWVEDYQAAIDRGEKFIDKSKPVKNLYEMIRDSEIESNRANEIRHLFD